MTEPEARQPHRPLIWPDLLYEIQDRILQDSQPVYVVGGAVRDALMGRPVTDIDLTVPQGAVALARRIANTLSGDVFVLDSERDVGRALVDTPDGRFMVDVARFRAEDLAADLLDRDFTINAMAVALHGDLSALIDPLDGEQDVRDKVLRRCTPQSLAQRSDSRAACRAAERPTWGCASSRRRSRTFRRRSRHWAGLGRTAAR